MQSSVHLIKEEERMLELKNVSFRYAKDLPPVLKDVSLSFDKGEFVAITGRNGSGKTTLPVFSQDWKNRMPVLSSIMERM